MGSKIPVVSAPSVGMEPGRVINYQPTPTTEGGLEQAVGGVISDKVAPALGHIQDAADVERVNVEMRQLAEWKRSSIDDPEKGVLARQGVFAKGSTDEVDRQYREQGEQIKARLANGNQRTIFDQRFDADHRQLVGAVRAHETAQITKAGEEAFVARMDDLTSNAARSAAYGEPTGPMVAGIVEEAVQAAPLHGWGPDVVKMVVRKNVEKLHEQALATMTYYRRDYAGARRYLDDHRGEMQDKTMADWAQRLEAVEKPAREEEDRRTIWGKVEDQLGAGRPGYRFNEDLAHAVINEFPAGMVGPIRQRLDQDIEKARREQDRLDVESIGKIDIEQILKGASLGAIQQSLDYQGLDNNAKSIVERRLLAHQRDSAAEHSRARAVQRDIDSEFLAIYNAGITSDDEQERALWLAKTRDDLAKEFPDISERAFAQSKIHRNGAMNKEKFATFQQFVQVRASLAASLKSKGSETTRKGLDEFNTWWELHATPPTKEEMLQKARDLGAVYEKQVLGIIPTRPRGAQLTATERDSLKVAPPEEQKFGLARERTGVIDSKARAKAARAADIAEKKKRLPADYVLVERGGMPVGVHKSKLQPGEEAL